MAFVGLGILGLGIRRPDSAAPACMHQADLSGGSDIFGISLKISERVMRNVNFANFELASAAVAPLGIVLVFVVGDVLPAYVLMPSPSRCDQTAHAL